ncbi:hypothetical protein NA151_23765, partial [Salmonella sp. NW901]|uniref:hypothetical protein n=1 Tax=unclassified Salmonella TaxID=2614656 RepID=UPI003F43E563
VKRRSADGSVGSPHARVGNCQASNKAKGPIERLGLFAFISLWKKLSDNDADAFYIWFIPFILQVAYVLATDYSAHSWASP